MRAGKTDLTGQDPPPALSGRAAPGRKGGDVAEHYMVIAWVAEYGEDIGEKPETLGAFVRSAFHFGRYALRTDDEWRGIYKTWCGFNRKLHGEAS